MINMIRGDSAESIQNALRTNSNVRCRAGGSKSALSSDATLDLSPLSGVVQYDPSEYTFTALAGTPLEVVRNTLTENGQFMPFDPPMIQSGATLGGTVAAGLSGSGRFRYGGVRDFILGVKMITRSGEAVFGGSKVVKNAAGFDFPKLMCGSLGRFGIMLELTFKVFPLPEEFKTIRIECSDLQFAIRALSKMSRLPLDLTCLDLDPAGHLVIRLGGSKTALPDRIERIRATVDCRMNDIENDAEYWDGINDFQWLPSQHSLIKMPISPSQISDAEDFFNRMANTIPRRYCVAGNLLWIGWPRGESRAVLDGLCSSLNRQALAITGNWDSPHIGPSNTNTFGERIEAVFC